MGNIFFKCFDRNKSIIDISLGALAIYSALPSQKNSFMIKECLGWNFFIINTLSAIWMLVILTGAKYFNFSYHKKMFGLMFACS